MNKYTAFIDSKISSAKQENPLSVVVSDELNESKVTTVTIKILESQRRWLGAVARQVRDNNDEPVPPSDRVYPQHLIGVAIDLLKDSEVDWDEIRSIEDLRQELEKSDLSMRQIGQRQMFCNPEAGDRVAAINMSTKVPMEVDRWLQLKAYELGQPKNRIVLSLILWAMKQIG